MVQPANRKGAVNTSGMVHLKWSCTYVQAGLALNAELVKF